MYRRLLSPFCLAVNSGHSKYEILFFLPGITPEILNNGTSIYTKDDDIAHITCTSRGEPRPLVRWEKEGETVKDKDEGIAILSKTNGSIEESHLFVAVSGNGRRGEYICVVSNKEGVANQSFTITGKWTLLNNKETFK